MWLAVSRPASAIAPAQHEKTFVGGGDEKRADLATLSIRDEVQI
jgi:hypothetical protein